MLHLECHFYFMFRREHNLNSDNKLTANELLNLWNKLTPVKRPPNPKLAVGTLVWHTKPLHARTQWQPNLGTCSMIEVVSNNNYIVQTPEGQNISASAQQLRNYRPQ